MANLRGRVIAPLAQNENIGSWPTSNLAQYYAEVGPPCIPDRYSLQHVFAVGDSLITTGGLAIGFLGPR